MSNPGLNIPAIPSEVHPMVKQAITTMAAYIKTLEARITTLEGKQ